MKILLSFDLEEFDIPREYGQEIGQEAQMGISLGGLKKIMNLLEELGIKATFFSTAEFAKKYPKTILELSKKHEIASHSCSHSSFSPEDLKKSRLVLEKIARKKIIGFRMPRLKKVSDTELKKAGYIYNSSCNPFYLPGRYNNFFKKRVPYIHEGILNIPSSSATPVARIPNFYLLFKVLPLFIFKIISKINLIWDNWLTIYFHPWEFADLGKFRLPFYVKKPYGDAMLKKLKDYLVWLKSQGTFITFSEFAAYFLSKSRLSLL